jgi:hypothetical protein
MTNLFPDKIIYVLDTNIYKTQDEDKYNRKHNTLRVQNHYTETNTNNANKTWPLLHTIG